MATKLRSSIAALIFLLCTFSGCTRDIQTRDYQEALALVEQEKYKQALEVFDRVIKRSDRSPVALTAATKAASIAELNLKDPTRAIKYYHHIVLISPEASQRLSAQKHLADIYFSQLADYERAILEYSKLLDLPHGKDEALSYHFNLAKCYFYLNQFFQALVEVESIEKAGVKGEILFDALLLKGNIYLATKKINEAIKTYNDLIEQFPQKAQEERILLNLALCYEEQKEFKKAIAILEKLKTSYAAPEFIEVRIRKLQERMALQPGAQGLKK